VPAIFLRMQTCICSQPRLVEQFPASVAVDDLWRAASRSLLLSGLNSNSLCGTNESFQFAPKGQAWISCRVAEGRAL
jgi:hypothetical protein